MSSRRFLPGAAVLVLTLGSAVRPQAADSKSEAVPVKAPATVSQIKVLPDRAPDCSSLKAIAESVTRGCTTNDQKAVAVYNFLQLALYHLNYPSEQGGVPALKVLNSYGWSLCGGLHSIESSLWKELGWGWRFVGWDGHTTVEARYDDKWHYLDVFLKIYVWRPDKDAPGGRTIASEDDLLSDYDALMKKGLVVDPKRHSIYPKDNQFARVGGKLNWQAPSLLACDEQALKDFDDALKTQKKLGPSTSWSGINHANGSYSADVELAPGGSLTSTWDPVPGCHDWGSGRWTPAHGCGGHKDTRNDPGIGMVLEPYVSSKPARSYANGTLSFAPDFSTSAVTQSFAAIENAKYQGMALVPAAADKPGVVIARLVSPYNMVKGKGEAVGADSVEISTDGGKTYKTIDLADFTPAIKAGHHVAALFRITFKQALKSLRLEVIVQNNPGSLPFLSPGKNIVTVSVADPKALGQNRLAVTYAYRLGSRSKSFEQLYDEGNELAKGHGATWDKDATCVQKVFRAADLPAKFEIDCPTPKGRCPVYPRMVFLRREVLAPTAAPAPLPAGAVQSKPADPAELQELPNPFLIGTTPPPGPPN
jgi:hypothetical protein